jgi:ribosomal protein S8
MAIGERVLVTLMVSLMSRKTKHDLERDMAMDLRNMEKGSESSKTYVVKSKGKILRTIRSNEYLAGIEVREFKLRHMNEDVNLAYFKLPRKVEE